MSTAGDEQTSAATGRSPATATTLMLPVRGEIDLSNAADLGRTLDQALTRCADQGLDKLTLDLRELEFIGSCGLQEFLSAFDRGRQAGIQVVLLAPGRAVRRALQLSGVAQVMTIMTEPPE